MVVFYHKFTDTLSETDKNELMKFGFNIKTAQATIAAGSEILGRSGSEVSKCEKVMIVALSLRAVKA